MKKQFILMTTITAVIGVFLASQAMAQDKPNIVVIMTDNQGYGDLGCYGGVRAETPRIDKLASEGIQFLDFQVEPGCSPSRAAFQTGRMPVRSGNDGYVEPGQPGGLHPMEVTIAELLKGVGYSTAMYGKWHLGENDERHPQRQGYDEWYGITNTTVPVDPTLPGAGSLDLIQQKILYAKGGQKAKKVAENTLEMRSLMDRELTRRSVEFIETHAKKKPFFLFVPFTNPHHPVIPHPDFVGKSKGGAYTDALMEMDYNTGLILDAIDSAGIRDNTIVVYFSDNGPTRYSPEPDHNGDNGIWTGELGSAWEGGLRTVGMMRWPGKIKANWKSKEMFSEMDFFTTFAAITGAKVPTDRAIDGVDQTDYLLGKQSNSSRDSRIVVYDGHPNPVAVRYKQFKFHWITYSRENAPFQEAPQVLGQIPLVFNLDTDPKERYNLFGRSGGVAPFEPMMRDVMVPYMTSLRKFPNKDYSKMKRSK